MSDAQIKAAGDRVTLLVLPVLYRFAHRFGA